MNRVAVITACYGDVDRVWPAVRQTVPCDFHVFGQTAEGWQPHDMALCRQMPDVYRAKLPKILPEYCLTQRYDYYLWLDASIHLTSPNFLEVMLEQLGDGLWLACGHHQRSTVKEEVDFSLSWSRYAGEPLRTQYGHYLRLGFQDDCLYANTWFLRKSTTETSLMCEDWLNQILLWSYQDQVSLPFVFWRCLFTPTAVKHAICWTSDWHGYHGHLKQGYWR